MTLARSKTFRPWDADQAWLLTSSPAPAGPRNIRAYSQQVIAARDTCKGRFSSLMTDIQTGQRRDNVLYDWASKWRSG